MANELPFLKQKVPFLYEHFAQLIFIDYNVLTCGNSTDGSIEFLESFPDPDNKLILIKDFDPSEIIEYNGVSMIEKRKMFAKGSQYVADDIDIVWATDLDEFFNKELIDEIEGLYQTDPALVSVNIPHIVFVYNQFNSFGRVDLGLVRITKHRPGKIYGHCNFGTYGKTVTYDGNSIYHFAYVGFNRVSFKLDTFTRGRVNPRNREFLRKYSEALLNNKREIEIEHPNPDVRLKSSPYNGNYPDSIDVDTMINELNTYDLLQLGEYLA